MRQLWVQRLFKQRLEEVACKRTTLSNSDMGVVVRNCWMPWVRLMENGYRELIRRTRSAEQQVMKSLYLLQPTEAMHMSSKTVISSMMSGSTKKRSS